MEEAKHTPGPWHSGGQNKCTIYDKFGQRIANSFEGVLAKQVSDAQCEANACLMAAAPELLEALNIALIALEAISDEMTIGERYTSAGQHLIDALEPARDAIKSATGQ